MKPAGKRTVKASRKPKSSGPFYLLLALVAVAGIGALLYAATRPSEGPVTLSPVDTTLPKVESHGYVLGSPSAPVEVTEFADFECPGCGQFALVTEPDIRTRLVNTGQVRMRFIDFPLQMHKNTWNASRAAACADEQGKFWEMHDLIFQTQDQWNGEVTNKPDKVFKQLAAQLKLNTTQFDQCVDSRKYQAKIQAHQAIGLSRGAQGTPTFVIGNKVYPAGAPGYDEFKKWVDAALASSGSPLKAGGDTAAGTPLKKGD